MSRSQKFDPTTGWVDISDNEALTHIVQVVLSRLEVVEDRLAEMTKHRDEWRELAKMRGMLERIEEDGKVYNPQVPTDRLDWEGE